MTKEFGDPTFSEHKLELFRRYVRSLNRKQRKELFRAIDCEFNHDTVLEYLMSLKEKERFKILDEIPSRCFGYNPNNVDLSILSRAFRNLKKHERKIVIKDAGLQLIDEPMALEFIQLSSDRTQKKFRNVCLDLQPLEGKELFLEEVLDYIDFHLKKRQGKNVDEISDDDREAVAVWIAELEDKKKARKDIKDKERERKREEAKEEEERKEADKNRLVPASRNGTTQVKGGTHDDSSGEESSGTDGKDSSDESPSASSPSEDVSASEDEEKAKETSHEPTATSSKKDLKNDNENEVGHAENGEMYKSNSNSSKSKQDSNSSSKNYRVTEDTKKRKSTISTDFLPRSVKEEPPYYGTAEDQHQQKLQQQRRDEAESSSTSSVFRKDMEENEDNDSKYQTRDGPGLPKGSEHGENKGYAAKTPEPDRKYENDTAPDYKRRTAHYKKTTDYKKTNRPELQKHPNYSHQKYGSKGPYYDSMQSSGRVTKEAHGQGYQPGRYYGYENDTDHGSQKRQRYSRSDDRPAYKEPDYRRKYENDTESLPVYQKKRDSAHQNQRNDKLGYNKRTTNETDQKRDHSSKNGDAANGKREGQEEKEDDSRDNDVQAFTGVSKEEVSQAYEQNINKYTHQTNPLHPDEELDDDNEDQTKPKPEERSSNADKTHAENYSEKKSSTHYKNQKQQQIQGPSDGVYTPGDERYGGNLDGSKPRKARASHVSQRDAGEDPQQRSGVEEQAADQEPEDEPKPESYKSSKPTQWGVAQSKYKLPTQKEYDSPFADGKRPNRPYTPDHSKQRTDVGKRRSPYQEESKSRYRSDSRTYERRSRRSSSSMSRSQSPYSSHSKPSLQFKESRKPSYRDDRTLKSRGTNYGASYANNEQRQTMIGGAGAATCKSLESFEWCSRFYIPVFEAMVSLPRSK